MRLILIDSNSGYIWGDTADIGGKALPLHGTDEECAIAAARAVDEDIGDRGREYEFTRSAFGDTRTGYHVYRADIGGSEAVPVVIDGQSSEAIDAVTRDCERVGFVSCRSPE